MTRRSLACCAPLLLLALMLAASPAWAQSTICQDGFTGSNGTLIENHTADGPGCTSWTKLSTDSASIDTNKVAIGSTKEGKYEETTAPGTADYSVVIDTVGTGGSAGYAIGRVSNSGNDWYECGNDNTGGNAYLVLRSYVGGTLQTTIGSQIFQGGTGTYTLTMNGTTISCAKSGGNTLTGTNSDIAANGLGGFRMIGSGGPQLDNYAAQTLAGGGAPPVVRTLGSSGAGR